MFNPNTLELSLQKLQQCTPELKDMPMLLLQLWHHLWIFLPPHPNLIYHLRGGVIKKKGKLGTMSLIGGMGGGEKTCTRYY